MDFLEKLELLEDAEGDPALLALATVDLSYPDLPDADRAALRAALEAAAIPHWCDRDIVSALLDDQAGRLDTGPLNTGPLNTMPLNTGPLDTGPLDTGPLDRRPFSQEQWDLLTALSVLEPFPARGEAAVNVHEASRLAIRKHLAATDPVKFTALSARAAAYFAADHSDPGRIERVYHQLIADPDRGDAELDELGTGWSVDLSGAALAALTAVLTELEAARSLTGKPAVRAGLGIAQYVAFTRGAAGQAEPAARLLAAAETLGDPGLTIEALVLDGEVAAARAESAVARSRYAAALALSRRLAEDDPADLAQQRVLAVIHARLAELAGVRGDLAEAAREADTSLTIRQDLAERAPANRGFKRDLAIAHTRRAYLAIAGDVAAAEESAAAALALYAELTEMRPDEPYAQADLAEALTMRSELARTQHELTTASQLITEGIERWERLVARDPSNLGWLHGLAGAQLNGGDVAADQGEPAAAQGLYLRSLANRELIVALDPGGVQTRRDVAEALFRLCELAAGNGERERAREYLARTRAVVDELIQVAPDNGLWQEDLSLLDAWAAQLSDPAPQTVPAGPSAAATGSRGAAPGTWLTRLRRSATGLLRRRTR